MSRLDPPQVLVEATALAALADANHPDHTRVAVAYRDLVTRYRKDEVVLVAVDDHLRPYDVPGTEAGTLAHARWSLLRPRTGVFAPIDPLRVGHQHRRHAARSEVAADDLGLALTLVMCERHQVRQVLTLDDRFAGYDLAVVALPSPADG